jgi:hypothetical protein
MDGSGVGADGAGFDEIGVGLPTRLLATDLLG